MTLREFRKLIKEEVRKVVSEESKFPGDEFKVFGPARNQVYTAKKQGSGVHFIVDKEADGEGGEIYFPNTTTTQVYNALLDAKIIKDPVQGSKKIQSLKEKPVAQIEKIVKRYKALHK